MKKLLFLTLLLVFVSFSAFSQQSKKDSTKHWDFGTFSSVTIAQSSFQHWVAGGEDALAINGLSKIHLNYKEKNKSWTNSLYLGYGLMKQQEQPFKKTDDKIEFNSQFGVKAFDKFYYTVLFNFKTQFTPGYNYVNDTTKIKTSNFMSPGYFVFSIGLDYKQSKALQVYFSPVSGKVTVVTDPDLYPQGVYGLDPGKKVRYEFGAYAKINYKQEVLKNVNVSANLDLYSNYLHNPQNIDVNFTGFLAYKITNFLTFNFQTQAIYDDDIKIEDPRTGRKGPRLQLMEIFGLGITMQLPQ